MQIYLRIRPTDIPNDSYSFGNTTLYCKDINSQKKYQKKFKFTKIYGPDIKQEEFFKSCVTNKIISFINGVNCTLFTYGCTGAGKKILKH